ncbi:aspartyl-phosphate phosphatase Spo0E family protein [Paenibacillus agricola]|nr:aspartyl-phosphate phosphatase Spo0E family protein [Paenibacillus agricola]
MDKIETLRNQMVQEALDQGQLTNEKVVTLSQKLDRYIVFYQRLKKRSHY